MQIGLLGIIGLIFVVLKLTKAIEWSWWLVLLPFYIGLVIKYGFLALIILIIIVVVKAVLKVK